MLSLSTDYLADTGCPEPTLRAIAEAGFSHVHWCHQWNTDFLYSQYEIAQIVKWLADCGLAVTDLHGSAGKEKGWVSCREYERLAGVELVANRIEMAARLSADVVIMHIRAEPVEASRNTLYWTQLQKSLDVLMPIARDSGVRIALENAGADNFDTIEKVFARCGPDYVGLCYDSGHGNVAGNGPDRLEKVKDRLISVHFHDNDGTADQHDLPFSGTVDWERLTGIIARSSYRKWVSLEVTMEGSGIEDERVFLRSAFEAASALSRMIGERR